MRIRSRNKVSTNFSSSSMTDLVFLLLIFFMLLSTLVTQNAMKLNLPSSTRDKQPARKVVLSINADLQYFINQENVQFSEIEGRLASLLGNEEQKAILLEMDKTVAVDEMIKVMTIAKDNGIKVALATEAR